MKVLWICGLPRGIRRAGTGHPSELSWVVGHLPPPEGVDLHILCPVLGLESSPSPLTFTCREATWHLFPLKPYEPLFLRRRFARSVRSFVRELKPDVVHGWGGETGWGLLATYFSKRAVVSVQGLLRMLPQDEIKPCRGVERAERRIGEWFRRRLEVWTYRRAAVCLCESETAKRELKRLYGVEGVVVPQPLRREFLEPCRGGEGREKGVGEGVGVQRTVKFLFVGQDVARKGYYDVQAAFEKVKGKCSLSLITGGKSAAEIAELMRTHDVFVLPSYGDTGPTAIKEALAMGMPVIAYDNTGPKELLEKYGGTLVKTGDVEALARAMREVGEKVGPCRGGEGEKRVGVGERIREDLAREKVWERLLGVYGG